MRIKKKSLKANGFVWNVLKEKKKKKKKKDNSAIKNS